MRQFVALCMKKLGVELTIHKNLECVMLNKSIVLIVSLFISNSIFAHPIDDAKGDMLQNEVKLLLAPETAGWSKEAVIDMGAAPRGDNTPSWWQPDNQIFKSSDYWNAITPWFVIYPGESHTATNVRVTISELKLYILKKSNNQWVKINSQTTPTWQTHLAHISVSTANEAVNVRTESTGIVSYKLNTAMNPIHGGISKYMIDGSDVKAVYVTMKTRLILDNPNGVDDRVNAQLAANVGADYYPDVNTEISEFYPKSYVPAVGFSRYGLIKTTTRTHYFATTDPPGEYNTGAQFPERNQNTTIPIEDFLSNPPPWIW